MFSLLVFLIVLSVLIVIHEFGHFITAKKIGVKVERFSMGFGPKLWGIKKGDTEYLICAIPLGGYVKLAGDNPEECKSKPFEYLMQPPGLRARIIFAGPFLNYILAFLLFWLVFFTGFPALTTQVGGLLDGFPAQKLGIKVGDRIIAVDGQKVELFEDMQRIIQAKKGEVVSLSISRDDQVLNMDIPTKVEDANTILGEKIKVGLIGIKPSDEVINKRYGPIASFALSARRVFDLTMLVYKSIWRMITRQLSFKESVTGPLGIFFVTSKAVHVGFSAVIHLMAVLSVSLAVFNLLPIPILDGGHLLFLGIEKIKGRQFSVKIDKLVNQFGLSLIILLAVLVFYNDLVKFGVFEKISGWFK